MIHPKESLFCPKEGGRLIHKTQKSSKTHISTYLPFPERSPSRVRQDPDVKPAAILSHFEMPLFLSNQAYSEREMAPFLLLHGAFPLDHWPGKNHKVFHLRHLRSKILQISLRTCGHAGQKGSRKETFEERCGGRSCGQ